MEKNYYQELTKMTQEKIDEIKTYHDNADNQAPSPPSPTFPNTRRSVGTTS